MKSCYKGDPKRNIYHWIVGSSWFSNWSGVQGPESSVAEFCGQPLWMMFRLQTWDFNKQDTIDHTVCSWLVRGIKTQFFILSQTGARDSNPFGSSVDSNPCRCDLDHDLAKKKNSLKGVSEEHTSVEFLLQKSIDKSLFFIHYI